MAVPSNLKINQLRKIVCPFQYDTPRRLKFYAFAAMKLKERLKDVDSKPDTQPVK